jgi:hypothetical protein
MPVYLLHEDHFDGAQLIQLLIFRSQQLAEGCIRKSGLRIVPGVCDLAHTGFLKQGRIEGKQIIRHSSHQNSGLRN